MKKLIAIVLSFTACTAFGAEITGGRMNAEKGVIEVDVRYGGGCEDHDFRIEMQGCLETYPVQCNAKLVDLTQDDFCEAMISRTIEFSLEKEGLAGAYYSQASLVIEGDRESSVTLSLPVRPESCLGY
jgi:hypothetical protein